MLFQHIKSILLILGWVTCDVSLFAAPSENAIPTKFSFYIENPREITYSVELKDGVLHYWRVWPAAPIKRKTKETVPTLAQWAEFRRALDELQIWNWRESYTGYRHTAPVYSKWATTIEYKDRKLSSSGIDAYPRADGKKVESVREESPTFVEYIIAARRLVGGNAFSAIERRIIGDGYALSRVEDRPSQMFLHIPNGSLASSVSDIGWRKPLIISREWAQSPNWDVINTSNGQQAKISDQKRRGDSKYRNIAIHPAMKAWELLHEAKPVW